MTLQEVTRKIMELNGYSVSMYSSEYDPTLEDMLVALCKKIDYNPSIYQSDNIIFIDVEIGIKLYWQLTKPLSQQSQLTIETITKILNT